MGSVLDEIVREGRPGDVRGGVAGLGVPPLAGEVAAYIDSFADQLDEAGRRMVLRPRVRSR